MKRRIIIICATVITTFSVTGTYLYLTSQQTSAPERTSSISKKDLPTSKPKDSNQHDKDKKIGSNKENFKLETGFGNKTLEVGRLTGKVSQESVNQNKNFEIKLTNDKTAAAKKREVLS